MVVAWLGRLLVVVGAAAALAVAVGAVVRPTAARLPCGSGGGSRGEVHLPGNERGVLGRRLGSRALPVLHSRNRHRCHQHDDQRSDLQLQGIQTARRHLDHRSRRHSHHNHLIDHNLLIHHLVHHHDHGRADCDYERGLGGSGGSVGRDRRGPQARHRRPQRPGRVRRHRLRAGILPRRSAGPRHHGGMDRARPRRRRPPTSRIHPLRRRRRHPPPRPLHRTLRRARSHPWMRRRNPLLPRPQRASRRDGGVPIASLRPARRTRRRLRRRRPRRLVRPRSGQTHSIGHHHRMRRRNPLLS